MIDLQKNAEEMIRRRGERVTSARTYILAMLLSERRVVTHHEIEERLKGKRRFDRVTLYRVLEWLNEKGLVHRVVRTELGASAQTPMKIPGSTLILNVSDAQGWSASMTSRLRIVARCQQDIVLGKLN